MTQNPQPDREGIIAAIIMVVALLIGGYACYKMVKKSKVWFDCTRQYVNLLERDKCVEERK